MSKALRVPDDTRLAVITRDGSRCARCLKNIGNIPSDVHHRCPRRMGGTRDPRINDPRNLVLLCRPCHDWVEAYREWAREAGWLLTSLDYLEYPVRATNGQHYYLTADGGKHRQPPPSEGTQP